MSYRIFLQQMIKIGGLKFLVPFSKKVSFFIKKYSFWPISNAALNL